MIINSISLDNIRSYTHEKIEFPTGSVLLAGDIGCGKSSILQSIEFALFGIQKGEIAGTDLLRHGQNNGHVEMCFEANDKEITIRRVLKKTKTGVSQDSGYIVIDGKKEEKTASEMRAIVLDILGYPADYQTKNPIIYRYTVYTPQEQIKKIIMDENRADILRKVFEIDKYSVIRQNAEIVISELKQRKRDLQSSSASLEKMKIEHENLLKNKESVLETITKNKSGLHAMKGSLEKEETKLEEKLADIKRINSRMQLVVKKQTEKRMLEDRMIRLQRDAESMEIKIREIVAHLSKEFEDFIIDENEIKKLKIEKEREKSNLIAKAGILGDEIRRLEKIMDNGICESCGQSVSDRNSFLSKIEERRAELKKMIACIENVKNETENIERDIKKFVETSFEKKRREEKRHQKNEYEMSISEMKNDLMLMEKTIRSLNSDLNEISIDETSLGKIESEEKMLRSVISEKRREVLQAEKSLSSMESDMKNLEKEISRYDREINEASEKKKKAEYISGIIEWIENLVCPLMEAMEKSIMTSIQSSFNDLFQNWFGVMISSEDMTVRIDDSFSPAIEQNGYQTEFQNLSGGEKTSVAMAYRLALNKVINDMADNIKTKDLIILDEPTDGFSSEQMDRLREVLNELHIRQTIIVSHEPKIDSFVDSVIRIHKENHVSRIAR